MFARFCKKNAIFPSSASSSSSRIPVSSSSSHLNINNRQLPDIPARQRDPPPPYWEHYHHPVLCDSTSDSDADDREFIDHNAFCPDLVRHCSTTSDNEDKDYVEIEEINRELATLDLDNVNELTEQTKEEIVVKNGLEEITTEQVMGQNLSLRRPRISLTWVLREQQQHQQEQQQLQEQQKQQPNQQIASSSSDRSIHGTQERKKKNRNHCERLFNEKYIKQECVNEYENNDRIPKNGLIITPPQQSAVVYTASVQEKLREGRKSERNKKQDDYQKFEKTSERYVEKTNNIGINSHTSEIGIKTTYSEPSLYTASDGPPRRHRQKKRKDRNRSQRFGYEIKNVDEFLSRCSLSSPANIPVVLAAANTLYQTRPGGYQIEIKLPLGMVVNGVFKNQNWLYVQTPHAEEGYVSYAACLPLGILPPARSSPTPCWENSGDVFPRPCGNMTDSEKEQQLRGTTTRSEGARTPRLRRTKMCNEKHVDALYLRAASQPKLVDKSYAQLKPTNKYKLNCSNGNDKPNDEYVSLQPKYKTQRIIKEQQQRPQSSTRSLRQTLLAVTENYTSDRLSLLKGDVVILLACKETRNQMHSQQWFYIRTREGLEGFIPAEVVGHGFL